MNTAWHIVLGKYEKRERQRQREGWEEREGKRGREGAERWREKAVVSQV